MYSYQKLEAYGIIGDLSTIALIADTGSIDWLCLPHMESPSVFGALLDVGAGGRFSIHPSVPYSSTQSYIKNTNVLQTSFKSDTGDAVLTDFMMIRSPLENGGPVLFRRLTGEKGFVEMDCLFWPRFRYGMVESGFRTAKGMIEAVGEGEGLYLYCSLDSVLKDGSAGMRFRIEADSTIWWILATEERTGFADHECDRQLRRTIRFWQEWAHNCEEPEKCVFGGPWHDLVVRSGLVLKLLTHRGTGAICAAPTTSLPEEIGGIRNWDYRFNWIRDASFTVQGLYNLGHISEARSFLRWFLGICREAGHPSRLQIMYGLHGEREMEEEILEHLSGYRNSRPVRIGNGAALQKQWDIYGEILNAVWETSRYGERISDDIWQFIVRIVDYMEKIWNQPDAGIWEVRSGEQHFVYSKVMCWVAMDRGIRMARLRGDRSIPDRWISVRDKIKTSILERGFDKELNTFVQAFGSNNLDATNLLLPILGFLPFDDRRVQSTLEATLKHLTTDEGLVYRYLGEDGLPGKEGVFILCTFWLIDALTLSGRGEEAERIFLKILDHVSPLGLLAEEIDPDTGEQLGNFPQAFSHIGLINSALYLGRAKGRIQKGPEPLGDQGKG
jgi:GH15 family glucan-1,4-alpha-glucosidase